MELRPRPNEEDEVATAMTLSFTKPHVLRNRREYKAAVAEIDTLLDLDPTRGSELYERLEFLSVLVQAYEDEHDPVDEAGTTAQSVVAFMLEQQGKTRSDLAPLLGGKGRVSEFFSGKRRLSIEQIRSLRDELGIPADLLIAQLYEAGLDAPTPHTSVVDLESVRRPVDSAISKRVYRHSAQEVCPWNVSFASELKEPAFAPRAVIAGKDARTLAEDLLAMSQEDFSAAFRKSPMKRAKLAGVQRNATVVLQDAGDR